MKLTRALQTISIIFAILIVGSIGYRVHAQNAPTANATPVQATQALYYVTPQTATAAAGSPAVLTIAAPPAGQYIYVCSIFLSASNNNTGAVLTNVTMTTTNFNSFATKFSVISANSNSYDWAMKIGDPSTGCAKSTSPATATVFTSPTSTNEAYVIGATFFNAP